MILGAALEELAGESWERLIEKELFQPLGMRGCGFGAPGAARPSAVPWGHRIDGSALVPVAPGPSADNPPSLGPAATVHCSLEAWGRFLELHARPNRTAAPLLAPATLTRLHTPVEGGDYAGGWIVLDRKWARGAVLTHSGSNTLWTATVLVAPAREIVIAVTTNADTTPATERPLGDLLVDLVKRYAP
jgi:CubicO group peptidase (beta-lactamase class C family)